MSTGTHYTLLTPNLKPLTYHPYSQPEMQERVKRVYRVGKHCQGDTRPNPTQTTLGDDYPQVFRVERFATTQLLYL
jgi:hypothetical protein